MTSDVAAAPSAVIGVAALARRVFAGDDLQSLADGLIARANAADLGALMDLSTLLLLTGDRDNGLSLQAQAVQAQRLYVREAEQHGGLRLLALMATGDTMANTPLDFLLEGSDVELVTLYVDADTLPVQPIPDHDLAFLAIGESEANRAALNCLEPYLARWPKPLLNGDAARIAGLSRDGVCALVDGLPGVAAPAAIRLDRQALNLGEVQTPYPLIIRPLGSQAGRGLVKLDRPDELPDYLATQADDLFYVSPFINYAGPDGLFRKQRIALIGGRPFVCHLAVSPRWMVHYMNADMADNPANRAEEAAFMAGFDDDFGRRHAQAFAGLAERIGLDYFAVDCAETSDGRLLLFEADVAMIVHNMDSPEVYPYKPPQMRKVFAAFQAMLARAALKPVRTG